MEVLEAEQALLGCVMKKSDLIKEIALESSHFSDTRHIQLFTAMKELEKNNELIDIVSLKIHFGQELLLLGGTSYLADLVNSVPSVENFKTYEKYILKGYKFRTAKSKIKLLNELDHIQDLEKIQKELTEIEEVLGQGQEKKFSLIESLNRINEDIETEKTGINGITTGFTDLDSMLDGWQLGDLNIIGARPSVGKTAFALSLCNAAAKNGHYVDIFSLEMSAELLLKRMICLIGGINSMKLKDAIRFFNDDDWRRYTNAHGILRNYLDNLYISDESSPTVNQIRARVRQSVKDYPTQKHLVIIDYLTLIKGSGRGERHLEVGEISRSLKGLARDLNVSVILLSQLSRKVEQRQDKRPMLSDLRDSGEVEQDADTISFLYRDDYYDADAENKNKVEVIVGKNRNGPLGKVELCFIKETNSFVNLQR